MASLRDIRKRIKSVRSTQKITKAMKMVAASKLRRAQEAAQQANPYSTAINQLLAGLVQEQTETQHPYVRVPQGKRRLLVVLSSDRGLCGSFNFALFKTLDRSLLEQREWKSLVMPLGRKAVAYCKRRKYPVFEGINQFWHDFSHAKALDLARDLGRRFVAGEFSRVDVLYNEFISVMSQRPKLQQLLPIQTAKSDKQESLTANKAILYEPDRSSLLTALLPRALEVATYRACMHSLASEFGARMAAMDSASRNAADMIDDLTLTMNQVRQATITKELMEIISGAEAIR